MSDFANYNDQMIAEFRANAGVTGHFGSGLLLVHSVGAKSGVERVHPLAGIPDGDGWLIAASKGGSDENPAWYHNLIANPDTVVEIPAGDHVETVPVRASEVPVSEHDEAWGKFTARSPGFADYAEKTSRPRIPVVRLSRR
ncbi:MAG: nitroreductase/quinone reductase family protein [Pseudolysinimonas sp.]|uniref:nitroreductase/quinone reductase family protein n=1 Tax=Pseudolysinimonas sp. TaxID=2680009 RepID=UPI0032652284